MFEAYCDGFLHHSAQSSPDCLLLTHGAGSNCQAPLLVAVADALSALSWNVYRYDLPFRRKRTRGSPFPAGSKYDREGISQAVESIRRVFSGQILIGGHSYGGRQTSMVAAEDAQLAHGLVLLSYPLHPPDKPAQLRTSHFPELRTKTLFVHGTRDPFGSVEEMRAATAIIPAVHALHIIPAAGHDLGRPPGKNAELVCAAIQDFYASTG